MAPKSPAQGFLEKADKKANSSTGWFSSASTKFEEAGDLYQQAANAFKIDKLFKEAGDAHAREAECREKCQESNEAAQAWWNAAKAYKRVSPDRECLPQVVTTHILIWCISSRNPGIVSNNYSPNPSGKVPSSSGSGERDCPDLYAGVE